MLAADISCRVRQSTVCVELELEVDRVRVALD